MSEPEGNSSSKPDYIFWGSVICLFGFSALIAIPNFARPRASGPTHSCINDLRQIDAAAKQFVLEHNLSNGAPINFPNDLTPYIKLNREGKIPGCPQGGIYHISKVGEKPTCSLGTTVTPSHVLS